MATSTRPEAEGAFSEYDADAPITQPTLSLGGWLR